MTIKSGRATVLAALLFLASFATWAPLSTLAAPQVSRADSAPALGTKRLQCLTAPAKTSRLPLSLPVGVETIHKDSDKIITIFVPLAPAGTASRMMNTNLKGPGAPLTDRFVISDGTVRTAFVGVDTTPGSRLDLCLNEILAVFPTKKPEGVFDYIRDRLQDDFLKEPPKEFTFAWDQNRKADSPELTELFHAAKDMTVGQYPLRSKTFDDVVPLEQFIQAGYGTCLHKALLASLLLTRLGIHHRLVNGATRLVGHVWIELDDGRILDPSLKQLDHAEIAKTLPGWLKYGETFAFENQVWPYLALD